jgi:hypothetical protein
MNTFLSVMAVLAVLAGVAVRLAIPILFTAMVVYFLRRIDQQWQAEGKAVPAVALKPACWETMGCSPARRRDCPGYQSALPCWQARRTSSGYLRDECLACKVFLKAPAPSLG